MKKVVSLSVLLVLLGFVNCKDNSVSEAECAPVVQSMFETFAKAAPNEDDLEKAKVMLMPVLLKECQSGKYNLDCLKNSKTIAEIQICKK